MVLVLAAVSMGTVVAVDTPWSDLTSSGWRRLLVRGLVAGVTILLAAGAGYIRTPRALTTVLSCWGLGAIAGMVGAAAVAERTVSSAPLAGHLVVITLIHVAVPVPRSTRAILAFLLSLGDAWLIANHAPFFAGIPLVPSLVVLAIVNAMGMLVAWEPEVARREQYVALQSEMAARRTLEEANAKVRALEGLLSICSNCKRIRGDAGDWQNLEEFIEARSSAQFSHGICQDCASELYPWITGQPGDR